jgi:hypothetical protein
VVAIVVAAVVVLVAVAVGLVFLLRGDGDPDPGSTATATSASRSQSPSSSSASPSSSSASPSSPSAPSSSPSGAPEEVPAGQPPGTLGDDPELDVLVEGCFAADWTACDTLYFDSDVGTEYESYGETCGGRNEPVSGGCEDRYTGGTGGGVPADLPPGRPAPTGGDPDLQAVAAECERGVVAFCDLLQLAALADPSLESYREYGATCGGRNEPVDSCTERYDG